MLLEYKRNEETRHSIIKSNKCVMINQT